MKRRDFLKSTVAVSTGLTILPSGTLSGVNAASNKLNIALIGTWGRGLVFDDVLKKNNVVALCDIDENHLGAAGEKYPGATKYIDWRKCLEQKGIEAVICATPDHHHAFVANWAMNRGQHVFCEKPLAISVEEARVVQATYQKYKHKLATQHGTQRNAFPNLSRIRELIQDGAIGELRWVRTWGNRRIRKDGYLPAKGQPPKTLHWDQWLGPAPNHPYNPGYFDAKNPGANCLNWNMFWDFGLGQAGDMGMHNMDIAWNAIDAGLPTAATAEGDPFNPDVTPVKLRLQFDHPANDWRGPITVFWHQGGDMPHSPLRHVELNRIPNGAMFMGTKGFLIADYRTRLIYPVGRDADFSYYSPRGEEKRIPDTGHFVEEWVNACKGDLKTSCDFDYAGKMCEQMALGLVAYRVGKKLEYDGKSGCVTNSPEANALLAKDYRKGWALNG